MWEFMKLQWRVECLWSIMVNNPRVSLAELVLRGELDEVLEGISEKERPEDNYITRMQYLRELIALGKRFLDIVDAEVRGAIAQIRDPYPGFEALPNSTPASPAVEIPIDEE
jgi:hypothetical protein